MKKLLSLVVAILTVCGACLFGGCGGEAVVEYKLSDDGTHYILSAVTGNKSALKAYEIPAEYSAEEGGQALPVTEIGEGAFYKCASLYSVTIPDTVKTIGNYAFAFTGLMEIEIPDSVEMVGYSAFGVCRGLKNVVIPSSVTSLGDRAFKKCNNLERVEVYAQITVLLEETFYNPVAASGVNVYLDTALKEVVLPATLKKIASTALHGNAITDIYFMGTQEQWDELYFYTYEKNDKNETVEKKLKKEDCIPSTTEIHFNYSPTAQ